MGSNLTRYNQTSSDRATASHDESLFGHYVEECGWTVKETLENLAPIAKQTYAQTVSVASSSKWLAVAGGIIGLLGGGTVGLIGALPLGAAALAFFAYREANQCISRREIELRALKQCPQLLDLLYGCHLKGVEAKNLIAAWDIFLDNYEESGSADANLMAREYLRVLDGLCFTIDQGGGVPMPQELPEKQPARIQTQLGEQSAIEVPVQTSNWNDSPAQAPVDTIQQVKAVCDRNNSFYIAGSKGSGKGMFAANLLRWKLDQFPNAIALILDPKGDLKESGYWQHDRIKHFSFKGIALSSADYEKRVIEFLTEARNLVSQADVTRGMRLFLVLDEMLTVKESVSDKLFAEFRRFGVSAISTGDSEGIHLIAITQSFNAGDSFGSDEVLKNFTQVGFFRQDEYQRAKKLIQYGRSNSESLTSAEFNQMVSQSPVDRVMSIAGEFIPTPKLENYSAYDRDSGKVIKQMPIGSNPSEGDLLADQLKNEVAKRTVQVTNQENDLTEAIVKLIREQKDNEGWISTRDILRSVNKLFPGTTSGDIEGRCRTLAHVHPTKFEFRIVQGKGSPSKQVRAIN
ncbi:hypothetical protein [Leptolyngbya sp. NIES-2104]|uniref:hypothetical protein n=1 Tax=Leptolyngbya sp. NIES-2104 TaxID=1552121 RepID=UPI0006ECA797|nr:hypothetical protein [Leptolyngbya sp. NIES-2104]GAP96108.1 hypothetical protein NIES2104_26430 [Leptolyngbya sp. NIES-2104]